VTTSISAGRRHAPSRLVLVRHGESIGNVADRTARQRGEGRLDLDERDADVALSDTGGEQARAVGAYLARLGNDERPTVVLSSPYRRGLDTARKAIAHLGDSLPVTVDERLRERDLGAFDGLTGSGIRELDPSEADRRSKVGKFYYRPPGGESWCDVALRTRSLLTEIRQECDGERVWVFSHQAVIMSFRFVLEGLDEHALLAIDADTPMANCSLTTYVRDEGGALVLESYGDTVAVDQAPADVTHEPKKAGQGETAVS